MSEQNPLDRIKEFSRSYTFENLFNNSSFLTDLGVNNIELDKAKSSKNALQYKIDDNTFGSSRIVVYPNHNKNGVAIFSNQTTERDKGDIVQFIKNRHEKYFDLLQKYSNGLVTTIQKVNTAFSTTKSYDFKLETYEKKSLSLPFDFLVEGEETFLTTKRGITQETLNAKLFKDRVLFYKPFAGREKYNAFFPKKNIHNEILGAEIKFYETAKNGMKDMVEGNPLLLWHSNIPEQVEKVVLVESALDALSHYQVHEDNNVFYVSSNGNLYDKRIESFYQLLDSYKISPTTKIELANDNDIAGFQYDIKMINHNLKSHNCFFRIDNTKTSHQITFINQSGAKGKEILNEVSSYFETIKQKINENILSESYHALDFVKCEVDNKEHVQQVSLNFSSKQFQQYYRKVGISLCNGLKTIQNTTNLSIKKPPISNKTTIKDWNDYAKLTMKNNQKKSISKSRKITNGIKINLK